MAPRPLPSTESICSIIITTTTTNERRAALDTHTDEWRGHAKDSAVHLHKNSHSSICLQAAKQPTPAHQATDTPHQQNTCYHHVLTPFSSKPTREQSTFTTKTSTITTTMQAKTAIKYIAMAVAAVTVLHAPQVHAKKMTSYAYRAPAGPAAPAAPVETAPVVSSSGKVIAPARVKVMQNEQKILGHSPYAKAAGVDLSQVGSNAVPVVTPAPVPAPAPVAAPVADASTAVANTDAVQTGAGY